MVISNGLIIKNIFTCLVVVVVVVVVVVDVVVVGIVVVVIGCNQKLSSLKVSFLFHRLLLTKYF